MRINKGLILCIQLLLSGGWVVLPAIVDAAMSDQQKMLKMIEQLDMLDKMDFDDAVEKGRVCIYERDFQCTEKQLKKAKKYAHGGGDKRILLAVKQELATVQKRVQEEIERERRRSKRERHRREEEEDKREEEAAQQRRDDKKRKRRRRDDLAYARSREDEYNRHQMIATIVNGVNDISNDMARSNSQFQSDLNRNYNDARRKKTERYEKERQSREKVERQRRAEADERRARARKEKREREAREWQIEQRRRTEAKKQRQQRSQRQVEKTASVANKPAEAYCWRNSKDYYFCYGPVQRLQAGENSLDRALSLVGCKDPSNTQQNNNMGRGKQKGVWFICFGRQLESYDHSPDKIRSWLSK